MVKQTASNVLIRILRYGIAAILVVSPFYATLSIWLASRLKHLTFFKAWKEIALVGLVFVLLAFLITHAALALRIARQKIVILIGFYILLLIGIGAYDLISGRVTKDAVLYGGLLDLRTVGIFMVALITAILGRQSRLAELPWRKIILIPAAAVVLFGLLQITVLPKDFLDHFGYGATTTTPYQTVDNQPNLVRIQATLKGPNPFGAYLLIVIALIVSCFTLAKNNRAKLLWVLFGVLALLVLYNTYSRSAEVGLILTLAVFMSLKNGAFISRHIVILAVAVLVVLGIGTLAAAKHNYLAQNVLFHTSNRSHSAVSSNAQRAGAMETATKDIYHHPLGSGIGSAGPASRRNTKGPTKIAENYYLQLGQEAGVIGMITFIVINAVLAYELWLRRHSEAERFLLATLIGLSFVNLTYHAWTDDTLAYLWWGIAGLTLAPAILNVEAKRKRNGQTKKKTA